MKILLVQNMTCFPETGGANKGNRLLMEALAERGHCCRLLALSTSVQGCQDRPRFRRELSRRQIHLVSSSDDVDVLHRGGVEIHAVTRGDRLRVHLAAQIEAFRPAWVLVSSEDAGQVLLGTALRIHPDGVVYLARTTSYLPFGPAGFAPSKTGHDFLRQAVGIATISRFLQQYLCQWGELSSELIRLPVLTLRDGFSPEFRCPEQGYVTMINPCAVKGISVFLALARKLPHVLFAAVPTWGTTEADLARLKDLPNVRILAVADRMDAIFRQTRVLLVPSLWFEAFGTIAAQAMLRGIPVLASDVGGLREAKQGVDYLLPVCPIESYTGSLDAKMMPQPIVPPQDVIPWLDALRMLLEDRHHYNALSEASRQAAQAAYLETRNPADVLLEYLYGLDTQDRGSSGTVPVDGARQRESALEARLTGLSVQRRALLALRAMRSRTNADIVRSIPAAPRTDALPLSLAQERLWFLHRMEPESSRAYNIHRAYRLAGPVDMAAVQQALDMIIRRHEILRTVIQWRDGQAIQAVRHSAHLPIQVMSARGDTQTERQEQVEQTLADEALYPFDLTRDPAIRAALLKTGANESILSVTMHHMLSDGWSMVLFFQELENLYQRVCGKDVSNLPKVPVQYADFAVWQRRQLAGEGFQKQLLYWKRQLDGLAPLVLPADHPRPPVQRYRGAGQTLVLSRDIAAELRAFSAREHATLFMTLLTAFAVLLSRLSGQDNFAVGFPVSGRVRREFEPLIGLFVNLLALHVRIPEESTFRTLLGHVRRQALDAFAHQEAPFDRVVRELELPRDASRSPVFQVLFNMLSYDTYSFRLDGTETERIFLRDDTSRYDLALYSREVNDAIELRLVYNTDLFADARIHEMLQQCRGILEQAVRHPDTRVYHYTMRTASSERMLPNPRLPLRSTWTESAVDRLRRRTHEDPQAEAIVHRDQIWCYADVNDWSDRVGAHLCASGVRPGDVVVVHAERNATLVVAVMAILKAGASFLICDSNLPFHRLAAQVRVAKARGWIELAESCRGRDALSEALNLPCFLEIPTEFSAIRALARRLPVERVDVPIRPDHPAYVIFTSGSSGGEPKGVLGTHRPLSHFLQWHCETFGLRRSDRFGMLSGLSHDPLLRDLFTPLWLGATLCVPMPEDMDRPARLAEWVEQQGITVMHLTPAMSDVLTGTSASRSGGKHGASSLRYVFFGGELLTRRTVERVRRRAPDATLVNFYGTTETPQAAAYYIVPDSASRPREDTGAPDRYGLPLGRGINDAQLLVLNKADQLAGIGELGEICVRTPYLSEGYVGNRKMTDERFIPNPYGQGSTDRLYRTGDFGRYDRNGNVEFHGRTDRQVKLRGLRIEPQEIEWFLCHHEAVKNAVVSVANDGPMGTRLIAHVVCDEAVSTVSLRGHLRQFLPDYMVPAQFVVVDALPLTANGKVDYRTLLSTIPQRTRQEGQAPPSTPMEKEIAAIWMELLGIDSIQRHDTFLDLGGHSLLMMKAAYLLEQRLGIDIPLREFFHQTLAQFAASCSERALHRGRSHVASSV